MADDTPEETKPANGLPVALGEVVGGKFRVERVIGEGGMGIVAEATHVHLDERVALKFLRRDVMKMPEVVARFDREARSAVKLKSEHVARVSDVGRTDDGVPYMVMELLDGTDLGKAVSDRGPLSMMDAADYLIQACEGVGEAHAKGIVHRDLKPENLFLVNRGDWGLVKVLDFGISKAVLVGPTSVDMSSHQTTSIMGSPFYMSPEQLRSTKSVDHRADIWSLGVVLFELLTGGTIFDETKEFTELVADILETRHRSLCRFRRDAPPELEAVIDRCLEKNREQRFQNVAELAVALLPFAPRRARVTVERTVAITKAAGLVSDPTFRMPPSNYPPPAISTAPTHPNLVSTVPPDPPLPTFGSSSPRAISSTPASAPQREPTPVATSAPAPAPPPPAKSRAWIGALVVVVLLLGIGVGMLFTRTPKPDATAQSPQPSATGATTNGTPQPTGTPAVTATDTGSIAPDSAVTASASKQSTPSTSKPRPATVGAKPVASSTPSTNRPTLEIQMER